MTLHYVYNISIHFSLSLIFDSSTTLVQMMPLLSKLLVHEWNKHNSVKVLYLFFVYWWVRLLQHDQIHNYTLKRGVLYMMSKRSLSSEPMPLQGHCASCLCFDDLHLISLIIILRVSFCSDIWYCNILTYYLGNILAYYQDNYSRRADSIMASFQLICHVHFLPESDTF